MAWNASRDLKVPSCSNKHSETSRHSGNVWNCGCAHFLNSHRSRRVCRAGGEDVGFKATGVRGGRRTFPVLHSCLVTAAFHATGAGVGFRGMKIHLWVMGFDLSFFSALFSPSSQGLCCGFAFVSDRLQAASCNQRLSGINRKIVLWFRFLRKAKRSCWNRGFSASSPPGAVGSC